jgi:hypothetical protein
VWRADRANGRRQADTVLAGETSVRTRTCRDSPRQNTTGPTVVKGLGYRVYSDRCQSQDLLSSIEVQVAAAVAPTMFYCMRCALVLCAVQQTLAFLIL